MGPATIQITDNASISCGGLLNFYISFGDTSHTYSVSATATFAWVPLTPIQAAAYGYPKAVIYVLSAAMGGGGASPSVSLQNATNEVSMNVVTKGPIIGVNGCVTWAGWTLGWPTYTATVTGTVTINYQ